MPYTPPSRSPALASPSLQDAASNKNLEVPTQHPQFVSPPRSPGGGRPNLPRSSSSRVQRHREALATENALHNASASGMMDAKKLNIDTGSPQPAHFDKPSIESAGSSSDDDDVHKAEQVDELKHAVRESFIANGVADKGPQAESLVTNIVNGTADESSLKDVVAPSDVPKLSNAARKISHSRSTTDSAIVFSPIQSATETPQRMSASDGSDEEVDLPNAKPRFVRKKSGELVKPAIRPNMRRKHSSMPGTPTFGKKGVHFNDDIAQVRHFLQVDRPMAVSAGGSPIENLDDEPEFPFHKADPAQFALDLHLGNFPRQSYERQSLPVRLEKLSLSADQKILQGEVVVANLAFHKSVVARFTFDSWRTTSEVSAQYIVRRGKALQEDGYDLFSFGILLSDQANLEKRTMFLCIRYNVGGSEYWDNNSNHNFQVDFSKKQVTAASASGRLQVAQSSQSPPRSRKGSSPMNGPTSQSNSLPPNLRNKPSLDDDFSSGFDLGPSFKFRQQTAPHLPDAPPAKRQNASGNQFGSRYDFGASLSAALSQAQAQLGDKSGIKFNDDPHKRSKTPPALARKMPDSNDTSESPRADGLLASKQPLDSRAYQEFVSKFCFFGSGKPTSPAQTTSLADNSPAKGKQLPASSDGQHDEHPVTKLRLGPSGLRLSKDEASAASPMPEEYSVAAIKLRQGYSAPAESTSPSSQDSRDFNSRSTSPASITLRYPQESTGWLSSNSRSPPAIHG